MRNMNIETLAKACRGQIICDESVLTSVKDVEIQGVVTDNRQVEKDYVFIPIVGNRVDGHSFIKKAVADGALFTLSERRLDDAGFPYVLVDDSKQALKDIAAFYRSQLTVPVIGVIGSVGKTGTKEMIATVLSQSYNVFKTQGNFNNEIGLPLTLLSVREEHEAVVAEMGISEFGEMHRLGEVARPDIVVMTNIGQVHLETLGDRDGVLKAKTEIFEHLPEGAVVILNTDDDKLAGISSVPGARIVGFGTGDQMIRADGIKTLGIDGVEARIHIGDEEWPVAVPLPGEHIIYHALAACAVGITLNMPMQKIIDGIENSKTIAGRTNFIHVKNDITIIDDCYNASPISMKAAITLLSRANGTKIAVLGDMGELGTDEKELHYEVGKHLSTLPVDELYTAGKLSAEIARAVTESGCHCQVHKYETRDAMIADLVCNVKPDSCILVKASHFMEFSKVVDELRINFG